MTKVQKIKAKGSRLKRFFSRRQHPIMILSYIAKYLWLLLIPLGKYLIATKFNFQDWIAANWVDILTLSVIIGYGFLRWVFIFFEIEEDCIVAHTGYFGVQKTRVYFSEMSSMSLCQGYVYRAIGACTLYIDTDAKSLQEADIKLNITQKQAMKIYEFATRKCRNMPKYIFNSKKSNLMIFSLLFSSTLSGVLLALTFIFEVYRIIGRETEEELFLRVNDELEKAASYIPKYLLVSALVVAGGWFISFMSNLMRHWNFSCTRCSDMLLIQSGKGTKRRHVLMRDRINYIDYQQSMLMKIFNICSVAVQCTGYGKRRLEISALIPITTNGRADVSIKMLMPGVPPERYDVRTGKADIGRFITLPIIFCFIPPAVYYLLKLYNPLKESEVLSFIDWDRDIKILAALSLIPLVWLLVVKLAAAFNTAVGFDNGHCTLSYCRFYRFHRTVVKLDRISKITITQNPMQKISRTCNLIIYTNSEKVSRHIVKGLNKKKITELLSECGYPFRDV
ncbi:MAG: PH domain-containing protein [Ruminococcus sp.]|nr:PH domain-containing protein [Ruminococcus sp.]